MIFKVPKGQNPYTAIGQYVSGHISVIEDMIVTIEVDGVEFNELFTVDMSAPGYFIWEHDWWEGEDDVALLDFFPVSDACGYMRPWIPISEKPPEEYGNYLVTFRNGEVDIGAFNPIDGRWIACDADGMYFTDRIGESKVIAWQCLPEPYAGD